MNGDGSVDDPRHLVLVGLMGSGKSTVGRLLAERLGRRLLDTDDEVERRAGRTVREIFVDDGEEVFRGLESDVLVEALASDEPSVIAAAGGVVLAEDNRSALRSDSCRVVWLTASPDVLLARVGRGVHRPLLDDDPAGALSTMADQREVLYREVADVIIRVDGRSPAEVVEAVLR
jgi:shikimate kinase